MSPSSTEPSHSPVSDDTLGELQGFVVPEVVPLDSPSVPIPPVIDTERALHRAADELAGASGPVAVDTERAQGIRYGRRAFLVQLKRDNKIYLIDPEAFKDLRIINDALADAEWVIHAAIQDFPSLDMLGMRPKHLFDTELGARLAGMERVNLGAVVEELLGYRLAKKHSKEDWSTRPLPKNWLNYASLDVDVLIDLRDAVEELLDSQGKLGIAREEFAHLCLMPAFDEQQYRAERWRKTKGRNELRSVRQLTALRNLWFERDKLAQKKDIDSKRLLSDAALVAAAKTMPHTVPGILEIPGFQTRLLKREAPRWVRAITDAARDHDPVPYSTPSSAPPPLKAWETKRPESLAIFTEVREVINALSERLDIPAQNIINTEYARRLCWEPPEPYSQDALAAALYECGARQWQVQLLAPQMHQIFVAHLEK